MIHIKRFLDKMSLLESRHAKDLVLPIAEARGLRDEVAKILSDLHTASLEQSAKEEVIKLEITGGRFK